MKQSLRVFGVTAGLVAISLCPPLGGQTRVATSQSTVITNDADAILSRRASVTINEPSLERAIRALVAQTKIVLQYQSETLDRHTKAVSLQMKNVSIRNILDTLFSGTSLRVRPLANGQIGIVDDSQSRTSAQQSATGVIRGIVTDSATGKRLGSVSITIDRRKISVLTTADGTFILRDLPPGDYLVVAKALGYRQASRTVTVQNDSTQTIRFVLAPSATMLSGVVTTATGAQERIKVGNDIATVNVPDVLRNAPVTNMSELLTNRIPGVIVQKTSGAPGAPSVIRIRGVSSLALNNDPIIVVDGVRIYSTVTDPADGSPIPGGLAPSALDGIDPNTVETVEVLRGPSAAALYGTDAANGIIVITTKRGQAGPARWSFSTQQGISSMPGKYPLFQRLWGRESIGGTLRCPVVAAANTRCLAYDSVVSFQNLNDDRTTVFGRGSIQNYSVSVSGGAQSLDYAFTISSNREIGYEKLPDVETSRLQRLTGIRIPDWQRRPNNASKTGGTSRVSVRLNSSADLALTSSVDRQVMNTTPLVDAIKRYFANPDASDSLITVNKVPHYQTRGEARRTTARFALNGRWTPIRALNLSGDLGWDRTDRSDQSLLQRGACPTCGAASSTYGAPRNDLGTFRSLRSTDDVISFNGRGTFQWLDWWQISGPTTFGINYTQSENGTMTIAAEELVIGGNSFLGASLITPGGRTNDARVAGIYIDQRIGLFGKYYTGFGLRMDAGSGLGRNASLPTFPKLEFSIPVITDENRWRQISMLRIRTAFGHAGRQPVITSRLRTFQPLETSIPGDVAGLGISTIGNTVLRPERSVEFEGGFDLGLWESRLEIGLTGYRKFTHDMLISVDLPPSVHGGFRQERNIGDVLNHGMNASIMARILDGQSVQWQLEGTIYSNRNRLVRFSKGMADLSGGSNVVASGGQFGGAALNVEGYPLNGFWFRPLLSYADENQDGVLATSELRFADSAVYLGTNQPKFDGGFGTSLGILGGRVRMQTRFNYQYGQLQTNQGFALGTATSPLQLQGAMMHHPVANDTLSSLHDRALVLSSAAFINTLSTLRWNELSVSVVAPQRIARLLRAGTMSIALQGQNLHVWSNYSGVDPNVRSRSSEAPLDEGQLPPARSWMLRVDLRR